MSEVKKLLHRHPSLQADAAVGQQGNQLEHAHLQQPPQSPKITTEFSLPQAPQRPFKSLKDGPWSSGAFFAVVGRWPGGLAKVIGAL